MRSLTSITVGLTGGRTVRSQLIREMEAPLSTWTDGRAKAGSGEHSCEFCAVRPQTSEKRFRAFLRFGCDFKGFPAASSPLFFSNGSASGALLPPPPPPPPLHTEKTFAPTKRVFHAAKSTKKRKTRREARRLVHEPRPNVPAEYPEGKSSVTWGINPHTPAASCVSGKERKRSTNQSSR